MLGRERRVLEFGAVDQVVHRHQAIQVHRARHLVEIVGGEAELPEQIGEDLVGTIVRGLQAHRIAVAARGQLALDGAQQIVDFFLLDEQIAVARDPELVAAAHAHAGEQLRDEGLDDGAEEHEVAAAQFVRQPDQARQRARRLHHGEAAVAAEAVLAFDHDGEIQALVEYLRERPRGIQRQRAQDRLHLAAEIVGQPRGLGLGPGFRRDEHHAVVREFRHEHVVQQLVLLVDQAHGAGADGLQLLGNRQAVRTALHRAGLQQFLEAGDADLEELVEIGARDAQELHPLEQRNAAVLGLLQHALIELQKRQLAIDVELRRL